MTTQKTLHDYERDDDDEKNEFEQHADAVESLPDVMRADYVACVLGDKSLRERADERGVSHGTVGNNVQEAKRRVEP